MPLVGNSLARALQGNRPRLPRVRAVDPGGRPVNRLRMWPSPHWEKSCLRRKWRGKLLGRPCPAPTCRRSVWYLQGLSALTGRPPSVLCRFLRTARSPLLGQVLLRLVLTALYSFLSSSVTSGFCVSLRESLAFYRRPQPMRVPVSRQCADQSQQS